MWKNCWDYGRTDSERYLCSGKTASRGTEDPEKKYLEEIQVHEQQEWDFEYVHQKTGERRWFHNVAMGSEVNGKRNISWLCQIVPLTGK